MEAQICQLLAQCSSSEANVRMRAELDLRQAETTLPDYAAILLRCALEPSVDKFIRQSAGLALKNYIDTHWSSQVERFTGPEPPAEVKAQVRAGVLRGLADPERAIRTACAVAVAKIAHQDWPEQWPDLMDALVQLLRDGSPDQVHGALVCLNDILQVDMVDQQISTIVPVLSQELLRIVGADQVYPGVTRTRSIKVFRTCLEALHMLKDTHRKQVNALVDAMLPEWLNMLLQLLRLSGVDETVALLKLEAVRALSAVIVAFASRVANQFATILETVWQDLEQYRNFYVVESANEESLVTWTGQDEDGDACGMATLLMAEIEFQNQCVRKKAARDVYLRSGDATFLTQAISLLVAYMQITQEQAEAWMEDAGRFIQDEDEDSLNSSVRTSAIDMLRQLSERFPVETVPCVLKVCDQYLTASEASKAARSNDWWRIEEACFTAISQVTDALQETLSKQPGALRFAGKDLLMELIPDRMQQQAYPFLQGRVLLLSGQLVEQYSAEQVAQLVQAVVSLLSQPCSIPVRVSAMKTLNSYSQHSEKSVLRPHRMFVISDAVNLVKVAQGETLQLVLETLYAFLRVPDEPLQQMNVVASTLLEAFMRAPNDHINTSIILDIFELTWKQPEAALQTFNTVEPFIVQHLSNASNVTQTEVISFVLDLLSQMARAAPTSVPPERLGQIFGLLLDMLMATADHDLLQSGEQCLTSIIRWNSVFITDWKDVHGRTGLERSMDYIAKLLDPQMSEWAGATVGSLITCLVQKAGDRIQASLPMLLHAVITRLSNIQTATQIQSLVMVFAELLRSQPQITIDFLCNTTVGQTSGMQVLLEKWCENHTSFHGYFSIQLSTYALSLLLTNLDPRLMQIQLKGDLIITSERRIVTRSRAKANPDRYTMVPAPVKIIKLLLADIPLQDVRRPVNEEEVVSDDEDGEWEDLDENDGAGPEQFGLLSDMLTAAGDDIEDADESAENPEIKKDPVYNMDMKQYLTDLFKAFAHNNAPVFQELANALNESERAELRKIISN